MLRLYLRDHLWRWVRACVRACVRVPLINASTFFLGFLTSRSANGIFVLYNIHVHFIYTCTFYLYMYILFIHANNMQIICK